MMNITFRNEGRKLSESDLSIVESHFNFKFPDQYKNFLLEHNGGIPGNVYYLVNDNGYVINFFLSLFVKELSFEEYFQDYKINTKVLPDRMVPIAEDAFGNAICISVSGEDYGAIFFWDHEDSDTEMRQIAISFNDFLNGLVEDIPE